MILTPFFPAFRARLAACGRHVHALRPPRLLQLEQRLGSFLPPGLLAQADAGPNSRERIFSIRRLCWGLLYQVLHPGCPCREVVRQVQARFQLHHRGPVAGGTAGDCTARKRLPRELRQRLRHAVATHAHQRLPLAEQNWQGLHPKLWDGTTVTLPDTPQNPRAYPQSRAPKPGCGFPLRKIVGLFRLSSGVLLDYAKGNKHQHERSWLQQLLDQFPPRDLAVADRGFSSYVWIAWLRRRGGAVGFACIRRDPPISGRESAWASRAGCLPGASPRRNRVICRSDCGSRFPMN